jgi:hypothetical protein
MTIDGLLIKHLFFMADPSTYHNNSGTKALQNGNLGTAQPQSECAMTWLSISHTQ